jgi:hypothetical protein
MMQFAVRSLLGFGLADPFLAFTRIGTDTAAFRPLLAVRLTRFKCASGDKTQDFDVKCNFTSASAGSGTLHNPLRMVGRGPLNATEWTFCCFFRLAHNGLS